MILECKTNIRVKVVCLMIPAIAGVLGVVMCSIFTSGKIHNIADIILFCIPLILVVASIIGLVTCSEDIQTIRIYEGDILVFISYSGKEYEVSVSDIQVSRYYADDITGLIIRFSDKQVFVRDSNKVPSYKDLERYLIEKSKVFAEI